VESTFDELDRDCEFVDTLAENYSRVRTDSPIKFNLGRLKVWYVLVRLLKPALVMETGVHDGLSSALILHAMKKNDRGTLVSIDLPSVDLPPGVEGAGWLVPTALRSRWRLQIGDSRKLLPRLVKQFEPIDIFIHDSDHSPDFQRFEYDTVRFHLKHPGLLLTDDAYPEFFVELAEQWGANCYLAAGGRLDGLSEAITLGAFRFDQAPATAQVAD
jgi:predicted O-methyltransferase YrrM